MLQINTTAETIYEMDILTEICIQEGVSQGDAQAILEAYRENTIQDLYAQGVPVAEAVAAILA